MRQAICLAGAQPHPRLGLSIAQPVADRQLPARALQHDTFVTVTAQDHGQAQAARQFHRRLQTGMFP
ncbi:hypothetical protein BJD12_09395 [Xanthomonas vesicatoria ATCC 35937]|uniref:Uncharacterized protein n=1 Tax=Xanthomonas vesicatoria TaxID=56460 RepID=A0AAJ0J0U7_9XANT|nr:hypothetical protein BI313_12205 [Xanthomonas vesicatoria]APP75431.1 hypothetical protein BJD12_09395 [Xanthomonas vesicatoria ATCC 35937]KHM94501.1 hypothetical protein OR60_10750 [Xanthomonas vesicatoria]KHM97352.1 hypothetical protein OR61_03955 [Xanthomonas vesicatoria]KTF33791.1 hypothetical protein LMG920_08465 [Xanthomonas vesicatoria]